MTDFAANANCYAKSIRDGSYNETSATTNPEPVRKFFREVGIQGKDILDVGCGTSLCPGSSVVELAEHKTDRWNSYIGIDLCQEAVDEFNRQYRNRNARAETGNAVALEKFSDNSKDIVASLFVLQELNQEHGMKALRELRRVAKPNAYALIGVTVNSKEIEEVKMWRGREVFIWNRDELMTFLSNEGFNIEEVVEIPGKHLNYPRQYIKARVMK